MAVVNVHLYRCGICRIKPAYALCLLRPPKSQENCRRVTTAPSASPFS